MTVAGGGQYRPVGVGGSATDLPLGSVSQLAIDGQDSVYVTDSSSNKSLFKITPAGLYTVVGGTDHSADYIVNSPILDASGNLFGIVGGTVVKIDSSGTRSTIVGANLPGVGYSGDGGPANAATLNTPGGIALDPIGNLYIADSNNHRIRKVTPNGIITTVAGNGTCCFTGDGVPATSTSLNRPEAVMVDSNGVLYIADTDNERIRRVGADGIITTVAGGSGRGFSGDGGPALLAVFHTPVALAAELNGAIDIADSNNHRIRRITPDGLIQTIAGTGEASFSGDDGPATLAALHAPIGVSTDSLGDVYIADSGNFRIRKIDRAGVITTFAGNGAFGASGDGGQARQAVLRSPYGVALDRAGKLYIADTNNNRIRMVAPNGVITTVVGGAAPGFAGDGGPASQALLLRPFSLTFDGEGNLYIADSGNLRVRKVDSNGTITTFAGGKQVRIISDTGDGGPATEASFSEVNDLAFDKGGNLLVAEGGFGGTGLIRRVSPDGIITTLVSGKTGGIAAIALDAAGNIYATVAGGSRPNSGGQIVRISPDGSSVTAITGFEGYPARVAFDSVGNLYLNAYINYEYGIALVTPSGVQTQIPLQGGFGEDRFVGSPANLTNDALGNLYVADANGNRIRKVYFNPASGLPQPSLQINLQPGYYIGAVTLGQSEQPGYWGMEILAPGSVLSGGLNLGGGVQQGGLPPGFGGVYLPVPETLHVHVDAKAVEASSSAQVALGVALLDASLKPVGPEQFGGTVVDFTQALSAGYYIAAVRGGANSPNANFQMSLGTTYITGGADAGGFASTNSVGFGAFYLNSPAQVSLQVFGQPTYGAVGAGSLRLTLFDAGRNVIATVP